MIKYWISVEHDPSSKALQTDILSNYHWVSVSWFQLAIIQNPEYSECKLIII